MQGVARGTMGGESFYVGKSPLRIKPKDSRWLEKDFSKAIMRVNETGFVFRDFLGRPTREFSILFYF